MDRSSIDTRHQQALLDTDPTGYAQLVLESLGLSASPLTAAEGWSNRVWLAPAHVVRISSGRFRDAYVHELAVLRMLPDSVPHALPVAYGRAGDREWMVLNRVEGQALARAWGRMTESQRHIAIESLGSALRALHTVQLPDGFSNPWVDDALLPGKAIENAYHAPPDQYRLLLEAASRVRGVDRGLLDELGMFIAERLDAFDRDQRALVHGDVHFANLMWDGNHLTALLDFEGSRPAAPDLELDTLLRFVREPQQYCGPGQQPGLTPQELTALPERLMSAYPGLFSHPQLTARLEVYEALWQLVQLHHFSPSSGLPDPWGQLKALLESKNHWARF